MIRFEIDILSVDGSGRVTLDWGDSGRISGTWDAVNKTLTVFDNQVYVLNRGVLGGANERYSGVAFKNGEEWGSVGSTIVGSWRMTEYRKKHNDTLIFDIDILSIDGDGTVTLDWGDSGRITGKWDAWNRTLTVHHEQVYVFQGGMLGGGNDRYSGLAVRRN